MEFNRDFTITPLVSYESQLQDDDGRVTRYPDKRAYTAACHRKKKPSLSYEQDGR